jgi:hypothetical protein
VFPEQAEELETVAVVDQQPVAEVIRDGIRKHIETHKRDR